jgi:hypothetical protein
VGGQGDARGVGAEAVAILVNVVAETNPPVVAVAGIEVLVVEVTVSSAVNVMLIEEGGNIIAVAEKKGNKDMRRGR